MGFTREKITIVGPLKSRELTALFDSGAYRSYVRTDIGDDIGYNTYEGERNVILANSTITRGSKVRFESLSVRGLQVHDPEAILLDELTDEAIVGVKVMQELGISVSPPREQIEFSDERRRPSS
jgi:hypothetical protein